MAVALSPMWYFVLSVALFSIGIFGIMTLKSGIRVLMAIELMLNAANLNFAAFGKMWAASLPVVTQTGYAFALFGIAVAAAEAAVGLAIFVGLFRLKQGIDVDKADLLRW